VTEHRHAVPSIQPDSRLVDRIDQCLPQTQCTLCSYPGCREYAEAIANDAAGINQCPPGGKVTIRALAALLDKPVLPLNEMHGITEPRAIARIDEAGCIGCKLCIKACPVDCIVGAAKLMHTVIAAECTGCKLCLPACPTDCIALCEPEPPGGSGKTMSPWPGFTRNEVMQARQNTERKRLRIQQRKREKTRQRRKLAREQMQKEILKAVERKAKQRPGP